MAASTPSADDSPEKMGQLDADMTSQGENGGSQSPTGPARGQQSEHGSCRSVQSNAQSPPSAELSPSFRRCLETVQDVPPDLSLKLLAGLKELADKARARTCQVTRMPLLLANTTCA